MFNRIQTSFTYNADRVVGNGSFGVVFQVSILIFNENPIRQLSQKLEKSLQLRRFTRTNAIRIENFK